MLFLAWKGGFIDQLLEKQVEAVTWFHKTGALKPKVDVVYQGYKVGEVATIGPDQERRLIKVTFLINEKDLPIISSTSIVTITSATMLSDPYLELTSLLNPDTASLVRGKRHMVPPTSGVTGGVYEFDSIDPYTLTDAIAEAGPIIRDFRVLTSNFDAWSDTISVILDGTDRFINGFLNDPAMKQKVDVILSGFAETSRGLPTTMAKANGMLDSGRSMCDTISRLVASDTVNHIMSNADEMVLNARVLTYGLAESPWRIVWQDKAWKERVDARDPSVINGSLRRPGDTTSATPSTGGASWSSPNKGDRRVPGNWGNPSAPQPN